MLIRDENVDPQFHFSSSRNMSGDQIYSKPPESVQKMREKAGENKELWKRLVVLGRVMTAGRIEGN